MKLHNNLDLTWISFRGAHQRDSAGLDFLLLPYTAMAICILLILLLLLLMGAISRGREIFRDNERRHAPESQEGRGAREECSDFVKPQEYGKNGEQNAE